MTLPEAIIELRELRWELEERRWRDTGILARLWANERHFEDGPVIRLGLPQHNRSRRLMALRIAEQVLIELENGPKLNDEER